jgi:hypothetical protein
MRISIPIVIALILASSCDDSPTSPSVDNPVSGTITAIVVDPYDGNPSFLVEELPEESDQGQKIFFHVSAETEIAIRLRSDLLVPGSITDLVIGASVRAWKGPVETLSYPGGTWAPRMEVIR